MTIYKFQNGTKDYAVAVTYSTHGEELRLQSDDVPESELYLHASSVAFLALELFGIGNVRASLRDIAFTDGQHGRMTRVSLDVPTSYDENARMVLPAMTRRDAEDPITHDADPSHPRNAYNIAVNLLEEAIKGYVQGRRQQMAFDFNAETGRKVQEGVDEIVSRGARVLPYAGAQA